MKFSVGFALYDAEPNFTESIRLRFTAMSLLIHHPLVGEIVIVDNNPIKSNPLRELQDKTGGVIRYVEMPTPKGTAVPRNKVFEEAKLNHVVCMDPHVLLYPGTLEALAAFYKEHGDNSQDLLHGIMMTERKDNVMSTHMNDQWRVEMWGTWGMAWVAPNGQMFSTVHLGEEEMIYMTLPQTVAEETRQITEKEQAEMGLPLMLGHSGHERVLIARGFQPASARKPFMIPGHGMGFFACRKDSWLQRPFDPRCVGFGGEEMTTGVRFRQAGLASWCVPGARWWHDFSRAENGRVPYPLTTWHKMRNYVIEFSRMGLPLDPIKHHFITSQGRPEHEWNEVITLKDWPAPAEHVTGYVASPEESFAKQSGVPIQNVLGEDAVRVNAGKSVCGQKTDIPAALEAIYKAMIGSPSPINVDLPHLRKMARTSAYLQKPGSVVEIVHQSVSSFALLAGRPKSLVSYGNPNPQRVADLQKYKHPETELVSLPRMPEPLETIPENDLLFLDVDPHTGPYYQQMLERFHRQCHRYIAIHDTIVYGKIYNNEEGVMPGIERFLESHKEWKVVAHHNKQNGLLVLSKQNDGEAEVTGAADEVFAALEVKDKPIPEPVKVPAEGPGTELKAVLESIGVKSKPNCDCNAKAAQMNIWGVPGCREHFNEIVGWMRDGMEKWGWAESLRAVAGAALTGLALKVSWRDPFPDIIRMAIDQAERKIKEKEAA